MTLGISSRDILETVFTPLTSIAKSAKMVALKLVKISVALSAIQNLGIQAEELNTKEALLLDDQVFSY